MKKLKKNITSQSKINGLTCDNKYIYLMGLVGISPEQAKKDIANTSKEIKSECSWKGYCKKCGMVHIDSISYI
jgi:hypothetical protein